MSCEIDQRWLGLRAELTKHEQLRGAQPHGVVRRSRADAKRVHHASEGIHRSRVITLAAHR
jgi:hypothetical protein